MSFLIIYNNDKNNNYHGFVLTCSFTKKGIYIRANLSKRELL